MNHLLHLYYKIIRYATLYISYCALFSVIFLDYYLLSAYYLIIIVNISGLLFITNINTILFLFLFTYNKIFLKIIN